MARPRAAPRHALVARARGHAFACACACASLLAAARPAGASPGDRSAAFRACEAACNADGCIPVGAALAPRGARCEPACGAAAGGADGSAEAPRPSLALPLRVLQWDCAADCAYRCMHAHHGARSARGLPALKYRGKWPFSRALGLQEAFSSAASVANLLAHVLARRRWTPAERAAEREGGYAAVWYAYTLTQANLWVWSALFHARDTPRTEALDYLSAAAGVLVCAACVWVRVAELRGARQALPFAAAAAAWTAHARYMLYVRFDYGWSVRFCIAVGLAQSLAMVGWAYLRRHPARATLAGFLIVLHVAMLLEILDFPPLFGLVDGTFRSRRQHTAHSTQRRGDRVERGLPCGDVTDSRMPSLFARSSARGVAHRFAAAGAVVVRRAAPRRVVAGCSTPGQGPMNHRMNDCS